MTLYYQDDLVTIYHGDCREWMPEADVIVTDPPYGIAAKWVGGRGHGWAKARDEGVLRNEWDGEPASMDFLMPLIYGKPALVWGGNHFPLPPSRGWLVWNKPERNFTLAEAELAWTNRDAVVRVYDDHRSDPDRKHPTQKPVGLMRWCIGLMPPGTILDPFMGSGSTLVAAKSLGRKSIGIEIEERYCEIAAQRCSQEVLGLTETAGEAG
jgi:DNA modification methylase